MSITVLEDYKGQSANSQVDGIWQILEATRKFSVRFENDSSIPAARPLLALDHPNIPQLWSQHPGNAWMYVESRNLEIFGPLDYYVTVSYRLRDNPLAEPAKVSGSYVQTEEPIDRDVNGKIITNSADELLDPQLTETFYDLVLNIEQNEMSFDPVVAGTYVGHINSEVFLGFPRGTVKCTIFTGEKTRAASTFFWVVRVEFQIRTSNLALGWLKRIPDAGYREKIDGKYYIIKDAEGNQETSLTRLNGYGMVLPEGAPDVFLEYQTLDYVNFNNLQFRIV